MGRGDKRSRKGKIFKGSNGKVRPKMKKIRAMKKKIAAKSTAKKK